MDRVSIDLTSRRALGFDVSEYQEQLELAREGLQLLADAPPERRAVLLEWAALAGFLVEQMPIWETHRHHGRHGDDRRHHRPVPHYGHRPRLSAHRARAREHAPDPRRHGRPGFAPTATMPVGLRQFADYQPFTPVTDTVRALLSGGPIGDHAVVTVAWSLGIAVGSYLWAIRLYNRRRAALPGSRPPL